MILEQHYLECLSQASYIVADETSRRAVVVDPRRDSSVYVDAAAERDLTIELIIETHFHADFLSGHLELAESTGAEIAYGSVAETEFPSRKLEDGERIELGPEVTLEIRHTPGHTPESISVVVEVNGAPDAVLTGDSLFIGDVGRPDLLTAVGASADELAGQLYDSIQTKLVTLPGSTKVFPGHGAGSACGKSMSSETWSTLQEQLATNYALQVPDREAFVAAVTEGQSLPPGYFSYDGDRNRQERELLDEDDAPPSMSLDAVLGAQADGAVVLDTREPVEFSRAHLIGSVNVGLSGRFSEFTGSMVKPGTPLVVVAEAGHALEAKVRLARIGFDNVIGELEDIEAVLLRAPELASSTKRLTVEEFELARDESGVVVLDVRQPGETAGGVVPGAVTIPLTRLSERLGELDADATTLVYCAGGFRSMIAASHLAAAGFHDVSDLLGGYGAWEAADL